MTYQSETIYIIDNKISKNSPIGFILIQQGGVSYEVLITVWGYDENSHEHLLVSELESTRQDFLTEIVSLKKQLSDWRNNVPDKILSCKACGR